MPSSTYKLGFIMEVFIVKMLLHSLHNILKNVTQRSSHEINLK